MFLVILELWKTCDKVISCKIIYGVEVQQGIFRVFNSRTRIVQETLHINFLENKPNVVGSGLTWLFDIDTLIQSVNYQPVVVENQPNHNADPQNIDADVTFDVKENETDVHVSTSGSDKTDNKNHNEKAKREAKGKSPVDSATRVRDLRAEFKEFSSNSTNRVNAASTPVTAAGPNPTNNTNSFNTKSPSDTAVSPTFGVTEKSSFVDLSNYPDDPDMPALEDIVYSNDEEAVGAKADLSNLEPNISVSPILTTRVYKDHPDTQIIGDLTSAPHIRKEPKKVHQALKDPSWIEAMQEELLQFKMKKEEGIDYDEFFAPVARIEAIRLFLAYASFMGFMVYQMDVKSAFLYGTIEKEVYVCQPLGFEDPDYPDKVYKVVKALYGLHYAPRAWYETLANYLLENGFQRGKIDQTLFIKKQKGDILLVQQKDDGIFINQDKHVAEILRKFGFTDVKSAGTLIKTKKSLLKDPDVEDVDVHIYMSMIGSLMYLTSSRPDNMYIKGKPHLGLWYPKDSPFNMVEYSDSDYAGASLDKKSTTGGCQFLGCRLISWQCKKQTVIATSLTEAEYVAAASCYAQVLWIQN
nr:hypothetical protein [Tanacetum cinerariifolium]